LCNKPLPLDAPGTYRYCPNTNHRTLQWDYLQEKMKRENYEAEMHAGH